MVDRRRTPYCFEENDNKKKMGYPLFDAVERVNPCQNNEKAKGICHQCILHLLRYSLCPVTEV